jgi:hypothetical protein
MRTSIRGAGQLTSEPVTPVVADAQWPALSTQLGAISVPVQRKLLPNVISATDG